MSPVPIPRRRRPGFSLPELLISMVLIGIIGLALTRLIVSEGRANSRQVLQRSARGVARGPLNLMLSELRMAEQSTAFVSVPTSTPMPTATSLALNVPWAIGIKCTDNVALMMPTDSVAAALGQVWNRGVAVRTGADGEYAQVHFGATVTPAVSSLACTAAGIEATGGAAMPGMVPYTTSAVMGGSVGTPVIFYYQVRYTFKTSTSVPDRLGLFRQVLNAGSGAAEEELVAPFANGSGFQYYRNTNRMPGGVPAVVDIGSIVGVQINLLGESERRAQGTASNERANVSTAVFFRNRL